MRFYSTDGNANQELFNGIKKIDSNAAKALVSAELKKRLIIQNCLKEHKIQDQADDSQIDLIFQSYCKKNSVNSSLELKNHLKEKKLTQEILKEQLIYGYQVETLKNIVITENELDALFIDKKSKFETIIFAIIRVEEKSLAKEIYNLITNENQQFDDMAKKHSYGVESKDGGFVGPVAICSLAPELKNNLLSMDTGEVTKPFALGKNFIIAKLLKINRLSLTNDMSLALKNELFNKWIDRQINLNTNY